MSSEFYFIVEDSSSYKTKQKPHHNYMQRFFSNVWMAFGIQLLFVRRFSHVFLVESVTGMAEALRETVLSVHAHTPLLSPVDFVYWR